MKYKTTAAFIKAIRSGKFSGNVVVDNDCVNAYDGDEMVCDFEDAAPECVLIAVLEAFGVKAERP